jgi:hypothetical protein
MLVSLPGVEVFSQALGEDDAAEGAGCQWAHLSIGCCFL